MYRKINNLTDIKNLNIPDIEKKRVGIVSSLWNYDITKNLYDGASNKLLEFGITNENLITKWVPGSFELIFGCKKMSNQKVDVIIAIGCVIKGETDHYDYICSSVANGIMKLNLSLDIPVIFCVLTDHDKGQSLERSGGKHGNKGVEAALSALKMISV